jgi:16S rRNA (cytosine967-C5)-methyltransferase
MKAMSLLNGVNDRKPRQIALRVLERRNHGEDYVETLLESELSLHRLSAVDRSLCQELVYGIVRRQATLDWLITRKTAGRAQKETLRLLLQLGLYQMFWLDRIPNHAAVHETVELAKQLGLGPQAGFLNAVLRAYTRERVETENLLMELKTTQPALGYSHPEWLCQRWSARWGPERAAQLMQWNNTAPPTFARVNSLKTNPAQLAAQWETERVKFAARSWDWTGDGLVFQLDSHPPLEGLRSFREGLFYVQDPGTLLAPRELEPRPGESVLDLCAAPGGKTTFLAQLMQNRGRIIAQDVQPGRLGLIRENCARLGTTCVEVSLAPNAIIPSPAKRFDRILLDAPCSNTGVMRRRVDLRWRIQPGEIERLRLAQLELLRQAAPRLKPGGVLVYSTCSLEPEENSGVVQQFLAEHPLFKLEEERELLPFVAGVDGAYVAKIALPGVSKAGKSPPVTSP